MKITEEKHNHKLTNLLKVFIFSVLMLLPFLNVAVRCAYVTFNKNAHESYYGETINEEIKTNIVNIDSFKINTTYYFTNNTSLVISGWSLDIRVHNLFNINNQTTINNVDRIRFASSNDGSFIYYYSDTNGYLGNFNLATNLNLSFIFDSYTNSNNYTNQLNDYIYYFTYNDYSYLDNVFEYSINKLEEEQYINWTQNTAVYQGVETMTTQLGITQTIIPMLIVYWFILTIIYVIIDIVLALFTKLTHMIGNKTT